MNLKELKQPYELITRGIDIKADDLITVANQYYTASTDIERNRCISIIILRTWSILNSIYYKQENTELSAEECYDIFMESIRYVLDKRIWENPESSLYGDKTAFEKAVATCARSFKVNYIRSLYTDKRFSNTYAMSIDANEEEYIEGYFTPYYDPDIICEMRMHSIIQQLFRDKQYLEAFILDAILNLNIFAESANYSFFSQRKLRKHLRHIDNSFCNLFAERYSLNKIEVETSTKYFINLSQNNLDKKIEMCLQDLRNNTIIRGEVGC